MKKKNKILLGILAAVLVIAGGLGWWQRNNLAALKLAMQHSGDELVTQMDENRQEMLDNVKEQADSSVRDLTEDEKQALRDQTITPEELVENLTRPQEDSSKPQNPQKPQKPEPPEKPPVNTADQLELDRCIAQLYVMQEEYTAWLEWANQAAIDEFNALPEKEQTGSSKQAIGLRYVGLAQEKEKECDRRMDELERKVKYLLKKMGRSTELVDSIHKTYLNEKSLKKAYYLSLH